MRNPFHRRKKTPALDTLQRMVKYAAVRLATHYGIPLAVFTLQEVLHELTHNVYVINAIQLEQEKT